MRPIAAKQCKICKKELRAIFKSWAPKKYCSKECGQKDNWDFKPRIKVCVVCKNNFTIISGLEVQTKTCSLECRQKFYKELAKKYYSKKELVVCKKCSKYYEAISAHKKRIGLCNLCIINKLKKERIGTGNPNYRSGLWAVGGLYYGKSKTAEIHTTACQKHRRHFLKANNYLFCERCKTNQSLQFSSHHIIFASEKPKHKELHNFKNLIMLCLNCHTLMHRDKSLRKELVKERELEKLFSDNKLNVYLKK